MPTTEKSEPICVEPDTCVTAVGKQELYFALEKERIALVFYASKVGYSNASGHRKVIHIQNQESIANLLRKAETELIGEEFNVTLYKPTQENSNDTVNALIRDTKIAYQRIFAKNSIQDEKAMDCGKLTLLGQVENYQPAVTAKGFFSFSSLTRLFKY